MRDAADQHDRGQRGGELQNESTLHELTFRYEVDANFTCD
jgi:hypothetical protein